MYLFLLVFHTISFFILLMVSYLVFRQKYLSNWKHLILVAGLCICYSLGYLLEVCSKSLDEARLSLTMEYLGLSFLPLIFFMFICDFCNFKVHRIVPVALTIFGCYIEGLVILCEVNTLYYTSVKFVQTGLFPHLELGHGVFYYLFMVEEFTLFIFSAVLIWKKRKRETDKKKKRFLAFMFITSLLPMFAVVFNVSKVFREYDVGPLMCTITLTVMISLMMNSSMTDVVGVSLTNLYYNLGNGIIILDNKGKFLDCNYVASGIFPELQDCAIGTPIKDFGIDFYENIEESFFKREGTYFSATASRIFNQGDHVGYIISIVDVTEMHTQLDKMAALKADADAASSAKSKFLATMSHEIRTPLNAIIGISTLSENETNPEVIKQNNNMIKSAGEMLLDIVSEVLDISKAESGKLDIVPVEYDLKELLEGVISVTNMRIGGKPIKLIVDVNPNIPRYLLGDNVRIRQILMNFLSNAEKYTDRGSITLKIDYEMNNDTSIILKGAIIDTGRGIKESDINLLFMPFTQVDTKKNHAILGTGLGLSIVDKLLELMGGSHEVTSKYGHGSTFSFSVPQVIVRNEPLSDKEYKAFDVPKYSSFILYGEDAPDNNPDAKTKEQEELHFPNARVLVVDDNKINIKVLSSFLKQFDIIADSVESGPDAIARFDTKEYDLIFMDHMMPGMNGIETVQVIRSLDNENARTVPIIACTANVIKSALDDFKSAGMDDYIPKPIILDQLKEIVGKYLG